MPVYTIYFILAETLAATKPTATKPTATAGATRSLNQHCLYTCIIMCGPVRSYIAVRMVVEVKIYGIVCISAMHIQKTRIRI